MREGSKREAPGLQARPVGREPDPKGRAQTTAMTHPDKAMVERVADEMDAEARQVRAIDASAEWQPYWRGYAEALDKYAHILISRAALTAIPNPQGGPDAAFIWKWVERAMFDKTIGMKNAVETLAHYPGAPWNNGRWDVDHKEYAAAFYAIFPNAALPPPPVQETE